MHCSRHTINALHNISPLNDMRFFLSNNNGYIFLKASTAECASMLKLWLLPNSEEWLLGWSVLRMCREHNFPQRETNKHQMIVCSCGLHKSFAFALRSRLEREYLFKFRVLFLFALARETKIVDAKAIYWNL